VAKLAGRSSSHRSKRLGNFVAQWLLDASRVTHLRLFYALSVMLAACATSPPVDIEPDEQSSKADGMAAHLHLLDDHRMDLDEPSDLAFADGKLYAVSDAHSKIYEVDDDGDVQDVTDIQGADLEALAIDNDGHFYIADESKAKVWRLQDDGDRDEGFEIDVSDGNSGIEGLTFNDDGDMLVGQENPAKIIVLDKSGDELDRVKLDYADDLSALSWNPGDKHLYALSDQEHKLFRLDSDFDKITSWKLPIDKPEGLAFDGKRVYIASDSEERLYVFELD
jgi:VCBS repeat-containing protein